MKVKRFLQKSFQSLEVGVRRTVHLHIQHPEYPPYRAGLVESFLLFTRLYFLQTKYIKLPFVPNTDLAFDCCRSKYVLPHVSVSHIFVCVFSLAPGSSPTSVTAWRRRAAWSTCARFSGTMSSSGPTSRSVLCARSPRCQSPTVHPVPIQCLRFLHISGSLNVSFPVFVWLNSVGRDEEAV